MDPPHKACDKRGKGPTRFRESDANTTYKLGSHICTERTADPKYLALRNKAGRHVHSENERMNELKTMKEED